jgi:trigger factor
MDVKVERTAPCRVEFSATVPSDEAVGEREKVVTSYLRRATLPGFRKGKAPRPMVERRYAEQIEEDLQERLLHQAWREAGEKKSFRPASDRIVIDGSWQDNGAYEVKGEVEVYPEVELPSLDVFTPPEFDLTPSDDEVQQQLDRLRDRQGVWEPVGETEVAAEDLLVEAEVHGDFPDGGGEPFHEERSLFRVGAGEVYPEIEAAVRGKAVGDEVTVERELGEEAGEERIGKRVVYRVTVKGLRRKKVPPADDEFARSLGIEDGLEALREKILAQLRLDKAHLRRDMWRAALVRHLAGDSTLVLPETVVVEETRKELIKLAQSLVGQGLDPNKPDVDWKQAETDLRGHVEERLRAELLLDALAEREGVEVGDDELTAELERQAARMQIPYAELRGNLAKSGGVERVRAVLRRERAVDEVLARAEPATRPDE